MGKLVKKADELDLGRRSFLKKAGILGLGAAIGYGLSKVPIKARALNADAPSLGWHQGSGSMITVGQIVTVDPSGPTYVLRDRYVGNMTTETTANQIFADAMSNA